MIEYANHICGTLINLSTKINHVLLKLCLFFVPNVCIINRFVAVLNNPKPCINRMLNVSSYDTASTG